MLVPPRRQHHGLPRAQAAGELRNAETSGASRPRRRRLRSLIKIGAVTAVLLVGIAVAHGDPRHATARRSSTKVRRATLGLPSRIYSDEFLLYVGLDVAAARVPRRLERLVPDRCRRAAAGASTARRPASRDRAARGGRRTRADAARPPGRRPGPASRGITDLDSGEALAAVALEPEELTGIYEGAGRTGGPSR